MYTHSISMSTSERSNQFDLEIHEGDCEECITVDGDVAYH
jgi:hypothetical protein